MFDKKHSWITIKYMPFSVFLLMIRYKWKIYKCKTNRLSQSSVHHGHYVGVTWSTENSAPALDRGSATWSRRDLCNGAGQSHSWRYVVYL